MLRKPTTAALRPFAPLRILSLAGSALASLGLVPSRADTVTSTWQGGAIGDWNTAANWSPSAFFPHNGNEGNTYAAFISEAEVTLTSHIDVDGLSLTDVALSGEHTLTTGHLGVTFAGANQLASGLTLRVTGQLGFSNSSASLTNHGTVQFDASGSSAYSASDATLTNASGGVIRFHPDSGTSVGTLYTSPFNLSNSGTVLADNGFANYLYAPVTNTGLIRVRSGSSLFLGGDFVQTAGEVRIENAGLSADTGRTLDFQGGLLRADGSISADLSLADTALEIGSASTASALHVFGDVLLLADTSVSFDLNGSDPGSGYDFLSVDGTVTLGGELSLRFSSPSFLATLGELDEFTILSATSIGGSFSNIQSGDRISLPDGAGSFLFTDTGSELKLSAFSPVPEPSGYAVLVGLGSLFAVVRRRSVRLTPR